MESERIFSLIGKVNPKGIVSESVIQNEDILIGESPYQSDLIYKGNREIFWLEEISAKKFLRDGIL